VGNGFRQNHQHVREIAKPADLKGPNGSGKIPGMKMYVVHLQAAGRERLGPRFSPSCTGALQQKTMDGQENPVSTIVSGKLHEVQKFCTLWDYLLPPDRDGREQRSSGTALTTRPRTS